MLDTSALEDVPPVRDAVRTLSRAAFSRALGANLRTERLARRLSLQDVERLSGLKKNTLRSWESGERMMPLEQLIAMAAFYGVPAAGLIP